MNTSVLYIASAAGAFALTALLTPVMRLLALRTGILDHPASPVKTHKAPVPYLGGLAIFAGAVIPLLLVRFFTDFPTGTLKALRALIVGGGAMLLIGLIDDVRRDGLHFRAKFIFQFLVAGLLILFDIKIKFVQPEFLGEILTILWVVGITNAINLIDIMDGLAAGIAGVASIAFLLIAIPTEMIFVNFAAATLAGACLAFLPYNLSRRGKIFMGDAGSLFLGFVLAALSISTSYTRINDIGIFAPLLILGLPILETLTLITWRIKRGQSPFLGSQDHYAIRLVALGFSRRQVLWLSLGLTLLLSLGAFAVTRLPLGPAALVFFAAAILGFFFTWWLAKAPVNK